MSFLSDYRTYSSGNEAPATFHLFASLSALASIISRRVWIDMGYYTLHPNLYIVLVGPPGIKKSTAISIAKGLLYTLRTVPFAGECTSKEKLVLDMVAQERTLEGIPDCYREKQGVYSPLTIMASELSEFFQISGDGMVGFLTDVFDINFPYEHKTKNKGSVIINGPYLNLIAGTTPSWMTTYLRQDIITGGFTRRCIFVYEAERGRRIWRPVITQAQRQAWALVYSAAERIQKIKGPMQFAPDADEFCCHWYEGLKSHPDSNLTGYHETKHVQLVKLAMLCALSESEALTIQLPHVSMAMSFLDLIEQNLSRVFEGMGRNEMNAVATKLLDILRRLTPTEYKTKDGKTEQLRMFPLKKLQSVLYAELPTNVPDAFNKLIQQLVQTDRIVIKSFSDGGLQREYAVLKEH